MKRSMLYYGKWLGVISSSITLILWLIFAYQNRFSQNEISGSTWTTIGLLIVAAIAGIFAALIEKPFLMILVFLFSFFPVGLYMLGVPSIFRWIGLSNLMFSFSSMLILLTRFKILMIK